LERKKVSTPPQEIPRKKNKMRFSDSVAPF
jgi:hypothetical protein